MTSRVVVESPAVVRLSAPFSLVSRLLLLPRVSSGPLCCPTLVRYVPPSCCRLLPQQVCAAVLQLLRFCCVCFVGSTPLPRPHQISRYCAHIAEFTPFISHVPSMLASAWWSSSAFLRAWSSVSPLVAPRCNTPPHDPSSPLIALHACVVRSTNASTTSSHVRAGVVDVRCASCFSLSARVSLSLLVVQSLRLPLLVQACSCTAARWTSPFFLSARTSPATCLRLCVCVCCREMILVAHTLCACSRAS
jgi:hypothetical protein